MSSWFSRGSGAGEGAAEGDVESGGTMLDSVPFLPKFGRSAPPPSSSSSWLPDVQGELSLGWRRRLVLFGMCCVAALVCVSMSFVSLPVLVLRPAKFAFFYSMANVFLLSGVVLMLGVGRTFSYLFKGKNLAASSVYLAALLLTLYSAIVLKLYLVTIAALVLQAGSITWFVAGHVPFLQAVLKRSLSLALSFLTK